MIPNQYLGETLSPNIRHQENQPVLDVHKLSVRYNGRLALDNLTFHLHAGERIAVVGPNGAGKSTLFKVVAGVLTPSSGEVNIYGSGPRGHVCIGYVPQRSQVDWRFPVTVADVAMMGRVARLGWLRMPGRKDWELVHSALSMVGLDDLHDRQISQLSGGQQQRMFIARALAQEAALMLMDEPFAGLDLPSREEILDLLDKLKSQSVTVMVATHDLEEAARYFDRIMLLNQRMFGFGTADIVLQYDRLRAAYGERLRQVDEDAKEWTVADTCCGEGETNGNAH
ncbi:MAG: manganese ABC transporter ATP-binding protein [Anaerolineae bacterium UTCFX2]|nr:metal ABC transporter ATP-binding protein [Anaerolineae bacterium]OQY93477.1 MAG: manganese ABC transporter ATP-binding protein [Anaerolineae bacterium UTCFX2]